MPSGQAFGKSFKRYFCRLKAFLKKSTVQFFATITNRGFSKLHFGVEKGPKCDQQILKCLLGQKNNFAQNSLKNKFRPSFRQNRSCIRLFNKVCCTFCVLQIYTSNFFSFRKCPSCWRSEFCSNGESSNNQAKLEPLNLT